MALLLVAVTPVRAEDATADREQIVGTYQGQAMSGGIVVEVFTTFALEKGDALVGTYRFLQDNEWFDGTLTKARFSGQRDVTFTWQDDFGAGTLAITFADDYQTFTGAWSVLEDTAEAFPWTGKRTK